MGPSAMLKMILDASGGETSSPHFMKMKMWTTPSFTEAFFHLKLVKTLNYLVQTFDNSFRARCLNVLRLTDFIAGLIEQALS